MSCQDVMKNIQEFAENRINDISAAEIQDHLNQCPACAHQLDSLRKMLSQMQKMPYPAKSADQWDKIHLSIMAKIDTEIDSTLKQNSNVRSFNNYRSIIKWSIAAALIISTVSLTAINFLGPQKSIEQQAMFSPLPIVPKVLQIQGIAYYENDSTLKKNALIPSGRSIRTGINASMSLLLDSGSCIDLKQSTSLHIDSCNSDKQILTLQHGEILASVSKRSTNQLFRIQTPNAACEVIGTRFSVTVDSSNESNSIRTTLTVFKGRVRFIMADNSAITVDSGNCFAVINNQFVSQTAEPENLTPAASVKKAIIPDYLKSNLSTNPVQASKKDAPNAVKNDENSILTEVQHLIDAGEFENALHKIDKTLANQAVVKNLKGILLQKKALCLRRLKKYEESITVLQTIINGPFKKEQKESAVFQSASINRNELHNFDAAISDLRRYTHDYPDGIWSEEVHYTLAELLHLKKDFDGAVSVYKKIIDTFSKSPRSESALYSLARLYSRDLSDCNRALNTYIRLETDFPESKFSEDASFWKSDCLFSQGRISQALKAYSEYLEKYPKGKWVAEARARVKTTATVGIDK